MARETSVSTVVIPRRCNGALHSGQGGYSSGVFSSLVAGPTDVSLRRPVPLDTALDVERDGGGARVLDGETVIAEIGAAPELTLDVPRVDLADARTAADRYRGTGLEEFSRCFVCGPDREDAFGVFTAQVGDRRIVASPWTPQARAADADGSALPAHVWAALDCPTYYASYLDGFVPSFLVRMQARLDAPVAAGEEHVVVGWPLETDGRKRHAASAVLGPGGEVLAVAQALLVEPR